MSTKLVLGIDHGYKNIKSEHFCFPTAIAELKSLPDDKSGVLEYSGKIYTENGQQIKFVNSSIKSDTEEFYLLTLFSIAKELKVRKLNHVEITLLAGLPQRWYESQKEEFQKYLEKNKNNIFFKYEGSSYDIKIEKVKIFEQGYAAFMTLPNIGEYLSGEACVVDIGGGTMDILPILNGKLQKSACKIDTHATIWLISKIQETIETELFNPISETNIIEYMKDGSSGTICNNKYEEIIKRELQDYCKMVYTILREKRINIDITPIIFVGGGAVIMKNFSANQNGQREYITNMKANAIGYQQIYKLLY